MASAKVRVMERHDLDRREKWYRQQCDEIAWREGIVIRAEGDDAYIDTNEGSRLLCQPRRPKKFWNETWLALKHSRPRQ